MNRVTTAIIRSLPDLTNFTPTEALFVLDSYNTVLKYIPKGYRGDLLQFTQNEINSTTQVSIAKHLGCTKQFVSIMLKKDNYNA